VEAYNEIRRRGGHRPRPSWIFSSVTRSGVHGGDPRFRREEAETGRCVSQGPAGASARTSRKTRRRRDVIYFVVTSKGYNYRGILRQSSARVRGHPSFPRPRDSLQREPGFRREKTISANPDWKKALFSPMIFGRGQRIAAANSPPERNHDDTADVATLSDLQRHRCGARSARRSALALTYAARHVRLRYSYTCTDYRGQRHDAE